MGRKTPARKLTMSQLEILQDANRISEMETHHDSCRAFSSTQPLLLSLHPHIITNIANRLLPEHRRSLFSLNASCKLIHSITNAIIWKTVFLDKRRMSGLSKGHGFRMKGWAFVKHIFLALNADEWFWDILVDAYGAWKDDSSVCTLDSFILHFFPRCQYIVDTDCIRFLQSRTPFPPSACQSRVWHIWMLSKSGFPNDDPSETANLVLQAYNAAIPNFKRQHLASHRLPDFFSPVGNAKPLYTNPESSQAARTRAEGDLLTAPSIWRLRSSPSHSNLPLAWFGNPTADAIVDVDGLFRLEFRIMDDGDTEGEVSEVMLEDGRISTVYALFQGVNSLFQGRGTVGSVPAVKEKLFLAIEAYSFEDVGRWISVLQRHPQKHARPFDLHIDFNYMFPRSEFTAGILALQTALQPKLTFKDRHPHGRTDSVLPRSIHLTVRPRKGQTSTLFGTLNLSESGSAKVAAIMRYEGCCPRLPYDEEYYLDGILAVDDEDLDMAAMLLTPV